MRKPAGIEDLIAEEAKELPMEQQKKVLDIVRVLKSSSSPRHSISELRGCGKKIWKGVDAQKYVDKIRAEWSRGN